MSSAATPVVAPRSSALPRMVGALVLLGVGFTAGTLTSQREEAPAESLTPAATAPAVSLEQSLKDRGYAVLSVFDAAPGIKGLVLDAPRPEIAYTSEDGSVVIRGGTMLNNQQAALNGTHFELYAPKPDFAAVYAELASVPSTTAGQGEKDVFVYYEPFCGFCNQLVNGFANHPELKVHYLPMAFLSPESMALGAAMLDDANDSLGFMKDMVNPAGRSKIAARYQAAGNSPETQAALQSIQSLFGKLQGNGTPLIFYKRADGSFKTLNQGLSPQQIEQLVADVAAG